MKDRSQKFTPQQPNRQPNHTETALTARHPAPIATASSCAGRADRLSSERSAVDDPCSIEGWEGCDTGRKNRALGISERRSRAQSTHFISSVGLPAASFRETAKGETSHLTILV